MREALQHLLAAVANALPKIAIAMMLSVFWALGTLARRIVGARAAYVQDRSVHDAPDPSFRTASSGWPDSLSPSTRWGVNLQAAVTAVGLRVAIRFALKDALSHFGSGVLILALAMRLFEIGDQIVIRDTERTVEQIELRATQIRTYHWKPVLVPNAEVFTSRIMNNTASHILSAVGLLVLYTVPIAGLLVRRRGERWRPCSS